MLSVPEHLEKYLGKINRGWNVPAESKYRFSVLEFLNWAEDNINTYSTLGVSDCCLSMPHNRSVRQEYIVCCDSTVDASEVSDFMMRISDMVLQKQRAILSGEVIGPGKALFDGTKMSAIYCTNPAIYPEGLHVYDEIEPSIVFAWLIPIYAEEAEFLSRKGPDAFESLLAEKNPELWDVKRKLLV